MANPIRKHPRIGDSVITVDDAIPAGSLTTAMHADGAITGVKASSVLRAKHIPATVPTVPTAAGTLELLLMANGAGTLSLAKVVFKDALTAHDTNFVTFALVNKGQAGGGSTAMLASSPAGTNTTKVTGGAAITAYVPYTFVLSGTGANLVVAAGDVLALQITGAGTLANTLTEGHVKLVFDQLT